MNKQQAETLNKIGEDVLYVEADTFDAEELEAADTSVPLIVPHNIDDLIAQHMLNLFNRYRDTDIPGTITLEIVAAASSGAREIAIKHKVTVGTWDQSGTFTSPSLKTSFEKAVERYRDQCAHEIKALPAS